MDKTVLTFIITKNLRRYVYQLLLHLTLQGRGALITRYAGYKDQAYQISKIYLRTSNYYKNYDTRPQLQDIFYITILLSQIIPKTHRSIFWTGTFFKTLEKIHNYIVTDFQVQKRMFRSIPVPEPNPNNNPNNRYPTQTPKQNQNNNRFHTKKECSGPSRYRNPT